MGTLLKDIQPETENIVSMGLTQGTKDSPLKPSTKNVTLKPRDNLIIPLDEIMSKPMLPKHKHQWSGIQMSTTLNTDPTPRAACKKCSANDPITIETTSMGITDLRMPTCTNPTSQMITTFQSANATSGEMTEDFHTANDKLPPGNPCASSTRRKKYLLMNLQ